MIHALQALWDWLLSWAIGWSLPPLTEPELPPLEYWCVVWIQDGRYTLAAVYQTEERARTAYRDCCSAYPDRYIWLIRVLDVHRPQPWRSP